MFKSVFVTALCVSALSGIECVMAATHHVTDDILIKSEALSGSTNWKEVISSTVTLSEIKGEEKRFCQDAIDIVESARTKGQVDWNGIGKSARLGNPIAQYTFAQYLFSLASKESNGIKTKIKTEAYMYALVSAIRGACSLASEDYFSEIEVPKSIDDDCGNLLALAKELASRL